MKNETSMFDEIKTLLVERAIDCPNCGEVLQNGSIMYRDDYRGDTVCGRCIDDWKEAVIAEEGVRGNYLK